MKKNRLLIIAFLFVISCSFTSVKAEEKSKTQYYTDPLSDISFKILDGWTLFYKENNKNKLNVLFGPVNDTNPYLVFNVSDAWLSLGDYFIEQGYLSPLEVDIDTFPQDEVKNYFQLMN